MKKMKLVIVDDHQIVIDGLLSLLSGHPGFDVRRTTTNPKEVLRILREEEADILLTDVMMPELNGAELAKLVKKECPEVKILALSMSGQGDVVNQMIEDADIAGYVLKNIGKAELIKALVRAGQVEVARPDTHVVPNSGPTVASRTCMVVGRVVQLATAELKEKHILFSA